MGLVAPRHVGSSQTRAQTRVPCIGRQILNHCATREALPIFFNQVVFSILSCMNYLYILDINPLSVISFENIFSHSVGCLFILPMVSFVVQKLLSLIRSHLFIFACFLCLRRQIQRNMAMIYNKLCPAHVFFFLKVV